MVLWGIRRSLSGSCEAVSQMLRRNREWRTDTCRNSSQSPLSCSGRVQRGPVHVSECVLVPEDLRVLTRPGKILPKTSKVKGLKGKFEKLTRWQTSLTIDSGVQRSYKLLTVTNKNCLGGPLSSVRDWVQFIFVCNTHPGRYFGGLSSLLLLRDSYLETFLEVCVKRGRSLTGRRPKVTVVLDNKKLWWCLDLSCPSLIPFNFTVFQVLKYL